MVYDYFNGAPHGNSLRRLAAVDRFAIDIILGPTPAARNSNTYTGIYNISSFDLSFSVKCSRDFYGKQCSIHCVEVPGVYLCDEMGTKVFFNESNDNATNCTLCEESFLKGKCTYL